MGNGIFPTLGSLLLKASCLPTKRAEGSQLVKQIRLISKVIIPPRIPEWQCADEKTPSV